MPKKIEKVNDLKFEKIDSADKNTGTFLSEKKSDSFKKAVGTAVVSDQITLFDEENEITLTNEQPAKNEEAKIEIKDLENKKEEVKEKKFNLLDFNRAPKTMLEIETTPEEESEKLGEAEETVKKQSSKKKKIWSLVFFLINIGVVAGLLVYQLLGDAQMTSISELFSSEINWGIFVFAIFLMSLTHLLDVAKVWLLTWKTTGKNRPFLAYKVCSLGKHYDSITPLSAGGEPFQVYYMNKHGIPPSKAVSIPVGIYVISQITFVILGLICMIGSLFLPTTNGNVGATVISASSWIGFSLNFLLIFLVILVSINKKIGHGLITGILKLLKKMRIIKDKQYESIYNKAMNLVGDYQKTMKGYAKNLGTFFSELFLSFANWFLRYCMPYIVYCIFFGFHSELFLSIFVQTVMIELASTFFPLPGGTGMAELSFTAFFSALMGPNIFWAMLFWRILTYYSYIIRGTIIIIYDYARGNKKQEWLEKKWKLEEESKQFEEAQLRDFEMSLMKQNKRKRKEK